MNVQNSRVRPRFRKMLGTQERTADSRSRDCKVSLTAIRPKPRLNSKTAAVCTNTRHASPIPQILTREDIYLAPSDFRTIVWFPRCYVGNYLGKRVATP